MIVNSPWSPDGKSPGIGKVNVCYDIIYDRIFDYLCLFYSYQYVSHNTSGTLVASG